MTPPEIDLTQPDAVRRELLDDDRTVREAFAQHLDGELHELAAVLAGCFRLIPALTDAANRSGTTQAAYISGFLSGALDDILTSTKLMLAGKLAASGNVMRQAVEGVAMAILCSSDEPLLLQHESRKQRAINAIYWERLEGDDRCAEGGRALSQLEWNAPALQLNGNAVAGLLDAKRHFNQFSHCGKVTLACRMSLEEVGAGYTGGGFDLAKVPGYRIEMQHRLGLSRLLPQIIERMTVRLTAPDAAAAAAAAPAQLADPA